MGPHRGEASNKRGSEASGALGALGASETPGTSPLPVVVGGGAIVGIALDAGEARLAVGVVGAANRETQGAGVGVVGELGADTGRALASGQS